MPDQFAFCSIEQCSRNRFDRGKVIGCSIGFLFEKKGLENKEIMKVEIDNRVFGQKPHFTLELFA